MKEHFAVSSDERGNFVMLEGRRMMNGNHFHHHQSYSESFLDRFSNDLLQSPRNGYASIHASSSSSSSSSSSAAALNSSPSPSSACSGVGYIEHRVSKMDTVAGVAIKYGVEVADIRRMNGLVTDLQMFALETLRIPLPGRHPPSPIVSNGSAANGEHTPPRQPHDDVLDSLQSLKLRPPRRVSPAMSTLQGYYGLGPSKKGALAEGTEMSVYKTGRTLQMEDEPRTRESPATEPGFSRHRKSRSLVSLENAVRVSEDKEAGDSNEADRSIRRRQKSDNDSSVQTPESLMKEDSGGGFLGRIAKGLALRPKLGSRVDVDACRQNSSLLGDFFNDVFVSVRKSSSTSNLQESENASSMWPTGKWSLKTDGIARPIFDGFPKPMTVRRKTAMD